MKTIHKLSVIALLLFFTSLLSIQIHGWFTIHKSSTITLSNINEPYYFDLLIETTSAPLLSDEQLNARIPEDYQTSVYKDAMNGLYTEDGLASFRLYADYLYQYDSTDPNIFQFEFSSNSYPINYRLAIIFLDGDIHLSQLVSQTKLTSVISYDLSTLNMTEFDPTASIEIIESDEISIAATILYSSLAILFSVLINIAIYLILGYHKKSLIIKAAITHLIMFGVMFGLIYWTNTTKIEIIPFIIMFLLAMFIFSQMFFAGIRRDETTPKRAMVYVIVADLIIFVSALMIYQNLFN